MSAIRLFNVYAFLILCLKTMIVYKYFTIYFHLAETLIH